MNMMLKYKFTSDQMLKIDFFFTEHEFCIYLLCFLDYTFVMNFGLVLIVLFMIPTYGTFCHEYLIIEIFPSAILSPIQYRLIKVF